MDQQNSKNREMVLLTDSLLGIRPHVASDSTRSRHRCPSRICFVSLRVFVLTASLLLLTAPWTLGQEETGSPYVHLGPLNAEKPLIFGTETQLLLDSEVLCAWHNIKRVQGVLQKHPDNPLLEADSPWEETARKSAGIQLGSTICDSRDRKFKF